MAVNAAHPSALAKVLQNTRGSTRTTRAIVERRAGPPRAPDSTARGIAAANPSHPHCPGRAASDETADDPRDRSPPSSRVADPAALDRAAA
jgi:hypothetical protein